MKEEFIIWNEALNDGLYEREEIMLVSLLAAIAGCNVFLYGPPGTAKSLITRRIASLFEGGTYFENLMQRFSTPEEIFGPVSLKELKVDNYVRKTEGYLPTADFAFLDEIWKSGPAILNTLLTIINEHKFKNGVNVEHVPLRCLFSASNEFPPEGQGLEALYDRFLVRLEVNPILGKDKFREALSSGSAKDLVKIDEKISQNALKKYREEIDGVKLSVDSLNVIESIRNRITAYNQSNNTCLYISDRRWILSMRLVKAAAYLNDRNETTTLDCMILAHCLWYSMADKESISKIIAESVVEQQFLAVISKYKNLQRRTEANRKEINKLLHDKNNFVEKDYQEYDQERGCYVWGVEGDDSTRILTRDNVFRGGYYPYYYEYEYFRGQRLTISGIVGEKLNWRYESYLIKDETTNKIFYLDNRRQRYEVYPIKAVIPDSVTVSKKIKSFKNQIDEYEKMHNTIDSIDYDSPIFLSSLYLDTLKNDIDNLHHKIRSSVKTMRENIEKWTKELKDSQRRPAES